ncbi:Hint domain-containing protein [Paracoccus sp. (in: a-proteobacteria)]|uniref:Hint domain-containing protein n=1 Tax=Paracoccus sp. TaxID=267 RepID=UPI00289D71C3|nr:Hint domain-containing protein [Paracoccus sp. (in: a-proteobacteria)]
MVDKTIDANVFGSFYENVGNNGSDDRVTVNIGPNFSGTITVDSQPSDGEYDSTIINIPEGWTLKIVNINEDSSTENPSYKDFSYEVLNADGQSVGTLSIRANNIQGAPCFVTGTLIETSSGAVPVEAIAVGQHVWTKDRGLQEVRWIGRRHISTQSLAACPDLLPIRIQAGALGNNTPTSDLLVSPQHRILVRSQIAQKLFATDEVLVAAKQLLQVQGIDIAKDLNEVEYFHILFENHEVVLSNGAETESLYTGPEALKLVGPAARAEIFKLFPELEDRDYTTAPARQLLSGRQARKLAVRHVQHDKPLVM